MKNKNQWFACGCVVTLLAVTFNTAIAQDTTKSKWHVLLEAYMMFPNMQGAVGLGTLPDASVDEDPGDIFNNFQFGAMLYAEFYNDDWAISSDFTYMSLGSDIAGKNGILTGEADLKQLGWELAGLRKLKPWLDAGIGFQLNSIKSDLNLVLNTPGTPTTAGSLSETWIDPSIIARVRLPLSAKWFFQFRGNIGGFGIGSDFYWQLQTYFGYRFSQLFQLSAGYRVIDMDYEKGSGSDRFKYDIATFGPVVRLGFNLK
jgi:hypothetical protein